MPGLASGTEPESHLLAVFRKGGEGDRHDESDFLRKPPRCFLAVSLRTQEPRSGPQSSGADSLSGGVAWLLRGRAGLGDVLELLSPIGTSLNSRVISFYFTSALCQVPVT